MSFSIEKILEEGVKLNSRKKSQNGTHKQSTGASNKTKSNRVNGKVNKGSSKNSMQSTNKEWQVKSPKLKTLVSKRTHNNNTGEKTINNIKNNKANRSPKSVDSNRRTNMQYAGSIDTSATRAMTDAFKKGTGNAATEIAKVFNLLAKTDFTIPNEISSNLKSEMAKSSKLIADELTSAINQLTISGVDVLNSIVIDFKEAINEVKRLAETFSIEHLVRLLTFIAAPLELMKSMESETFTISDISAFKQFGNSPQTAIDNINQLLLNNKSGLILDMDSVQKFNNLSKNYLHGNPSEIAHREYFMPLPICDYLVDVLYSLHVSPEIIASLGNYIYNNSITDADTFQYLDKYNARAIAINKLCKPLAYQQTVINEMKEFIKNWVAVGKNPNYSAVTGRAFKRKSYTDEEGYTDQRVISASEVFSADNGFKMYIKLFKDTVFNYLISINPLMNQFEINKQFSSYQDKTIDTVYEEFLEKTGIFKNMSKYHDDLTNFVADYMPRYILPEFSKVLHEQFVTKVDNSLGNHINQLVPEMVWPFNPFDTYREVEGKITTWDGEFWSSTDYSVKFEGLLRYYIKINTSYANVDDTGKPVDGSKRTPMLEHEWIHINNFGKVDKKSGKFEEGEIQILGDIWDDDVVGKLCTTLTDPVLVYNLYVDDRNRRTESVRMDFASHWDYFISFTRIMGNTHLEETRIHPMNYVLANSGEMASVGVGKRYLLGPAEDHRRNTSLRSGLETQFGLNQLLILDKPMLFQVKVKDGHLYRRHWPMMMPAFKLGLHNDSYIFDSEKLVWGYPDFAHALTRKDAIEYQSGRFKYADSSIPYLVAWDSSYMNKNNIKNRLDNSFQTAGDAFEIHKSGDWGFKDDDHVLHNNLTYLWIKAWQDIPGMFFDLYLFKLALYSPNVFRDLNKLNRTDNVVRYKTFLDCMNFKPVTEFKLHKTYIVKSLEAHKPLTALPIFKFVKDHPSWEPGEVARYKDYGVNPSKGLILGTKIIDDKYEPYSLVNDKIRYVCTRKMGKSDSAVISKEQILSAVESNNWSNIYPIMPTLNIDSVTSNDSDAFFIVNKDSFKKHTGIFSPIKGFNHQILSEWVWENAFVHTYIVSADSYTGVIAHLPKGEYVKDTPFMIVNHEKNCIDYSVKYDWSIYRAYEVETPSEIWNTHVNYACSYKSKLPAPVQKSESGDLPVISGFSKTPTKLAETLSAKFSYNNLSSSHGNGMRSFNSNEMPAKVWEQKIKVIESILKRFRDVLGEYNAGMIEVLTALRAINKNMILGWMPIKSGTWGILRGKYDSIAAKHQLCDDFPKMHDDMLPCFVANLNANVSLDSMTYIDATEILSATKDTAEFNKNKGTWDNGSGIRSMFSESELRKQKAHDTKMRKEELARLTARYEESHDSDSDTYTNSDSLARIIDGQPSNTDMQIKFFTGGYYLIPEADMRTFTRGTSSSPFFKFCYMNSKQDESAYINDKWVVINTGFIHESLAKLFANKYYLSSLR